eukprot:PITA_09082
MQATMESPEKKESEQEKPHGNSIKQTSHLRQIQENILKSSKATDSTHLTDRDGKMGFDLFKKLMEETEKKITSAISEVSAKLDLSSLQLINVPRSIELASALLKLDLSNNNLVCFPECVTCLVNLRSLDVASNRLKSLPNCIGQLLNIKTLNVSENALVTFPESIQNCNALEELIANFNHLEALPDTLGFNLTNLRKLSIHSNNITSLPPSISYMRSLCVLDVHSNKLRHLPEDIGHLKNLEVLNVSKNFHHLVDIPESVGRLACLMELDVSYNQISNLPDSIGALKKLQILGLEGNPLVFPPPEIVEHSVEAVKRYLGKRLMKNKHVKRHSAGHLSGWFACVTGGEWARLSCTGKRCNVSGRLSWDEYRTLKVDRHSLLPLSISLPISWLFSPQRSPPRRTVTPSHFGMQ